MEGRELSAANLHPVCRERAWGMLPAGTMPDQEGKGVWNGVSEGDGEEQVEVFQHLLEHLFAPFLIGLHGVEGKVERPGDFFVAFALEGKLVDAAQGRVQLADGLGRSDNGF